MKKVQNVLVAIAGVLTLLTIVNAILNRPFWATANEGQYLENINQTETFIAEIGETARQIAQENDLYASVMIAQAILESSSGSSELSRAPHYNLFGIKGEYAGQSATMATLEDDGTGNTYSVNEAFRSYPSYTASMYDYANLLRQGIYAGAWKSNTVSYYDATAALTGLYATDTHYNTKLNSLIQQYELTKYDNTANIEDLAGDSVYNEYRGSYTTQEVLDTDMAWANSN